MRVLVCLVLGMASALAWAENAEMSFGAMGDGPYSPAEWPVFARQIYDEGADERTDFLIFLGDIVRGVDELPEWYYSGVAGLMKSSRIPMYVVVGDNEWNDLIDPDKHFALWRKYFERMYESFPERPFTHAQMKQPDNFAFVHKGVLVIGLNLPGGTIQDADEWKRRHVHNVEWVNQCLEAYGDEVRAMVVCAQATPKLKHETFFGPFTKLVKDWGKPTLYIHGDGHTYEVHPEWRANNITRVQVDQVGKADPLMVTVTTDKDEPFRFDRRLEE